MYFGSTALKYWYPDFKREPKDIDIMASTSVDNVVVVETPVVVEKKTKKGNIVKLAARV